MATQASSTGNGKMKDESNCFTQWSRLFADLLKHRARNGGAIALLRSSWLIKFSRTCKMPLPNRQQLEEEAPEAFISQEELVSLSQGLWCSRIVVISHAWHTKGHPDPKRTTLERVAKGLEIYQEEFQEPLGVFWDFASLYQSERSGQQIELFKRGLIHGIPLIFMHPDTIIFQVTRIPREVSPDPGHNSLPAQDRGWMYAERMWSSYVKRYRESVFEIDEIADATCYADMLHRTENNRSIRRVPLRPQEFRNELKKQHFSYRLDDIDLIREIIDGVYKQMLDGIFKRSRSLYYNRLAWEDDDAAHLFSLLSDGYGPNLEMLDLSNNLLVDCFGPAFGNALEKCDHLVELDLSCNPIGNDGVASLSPWLNRLKRIRLCDVDLDEVGCSLMAAELLAVTNKRCGIIELDLSSNMIGDIGVEHLAPVLIDVKFVGLRHTGLTDKGCQSLDKYCYDQQPGHTNWEMMDLYGNQIQYSGTLVMLKDRCRVLNATGNPIAARSLVELENNDSHGLQTQTRDERNPEGGRSESEIERRIRESLETGSIVLISAEWLISFAKKGRPLPYRQQLVTEKGSTLSYEDLKALNSQFWCRNIVVLSHMWLSQKHPDPHRSTLQLVVRALSCLKEEFRGDFGLFWDFASLHQHPDPSRSLFRSKEETAKFEKGLDAIPSLFMCPDTFVFQLTELPNIAGFALEGQSAVRYEQRGWPFTEQSWSSLAKRCSGSIFNLSSLRHGSCYDDLYRRCAVNVRHVPLLPSAFDEEARSLKFGKEKDRDRVKLLYKDSFDNLFAKVRGLSYEKLDWKNENAREFFRVIDTGRTNLPDLENLNLSGNKLTARMCMELSKVLKSQFLPKLRELDLSDNPLRNKGFALLTSNLNQLERIHLRNIGLNEHGCRLLRARVSEAAIDTQTVVQLDLSHNIIGDGGVSAISNMFPGIKWLGLRHVGCSEAGCQALAESSPHELVSLDLYGNQITTCGSLVQLVERVSSLKSLNVGGNPIRDRSIRQLELCSDAKEELILLKTASQYIF